MVSPSNPERIAPESAMGSSSKLRSQTPHHDLKWAMNHTNSPILLVTDSDSDNNPKGSPVSEAPPKNRVSSISSPDHGTEKSEKKVVNGSPVWVDDNSESKATPSQGRPKIHLRSRQKNKKPVDDVSDAEEDQNFNAEDFEEDVPKTWNLRPRKPISLNENALSTGASANANKTSAKKEKKPTFSISLTKEEIEEDIFAMTGSLPSKKPTRRPKNVQKQLDLLYPGLMFDSMTPNSYKVPKSNKKG